MPHVANKRRRAITDPALTDNASVIGLALYAAGICSESVDGSLSPPASAKTEVEVEVEVESSGSLFPPASSAKTEVGVEVEVESSGSLSPPASAKTEVEMESSGSLSPPASSAKTEVGVDVEVEASEVESSLVSGGYTVDQEAPQEQNSLDGSDSDSSFRDRCGSLSSALATYKAACSIPRNISCGSDLANCAASCSLGDN